MRNGGSRRHASSGFTLIEVMVALAIFSLAVLTIMSVHTTSVRTATNIAAQARAEIVADNVLVRSLIDPATLELGFSRGSEALNGEAFRWVRNVRPTGRGEIVWIDVQVYDATSDSVLYSISGFRDNR